MTAVTDPLAVIAAARRRRLVPAVLALVAAGDLHPFDAEWIAGLPADRQLAAARKFAHSTCDTFQFELFPDAGRSVIGGGASGGSKWGRSQS